MTGQRAAACQQTALRELDKYYASLNADLEVFNNGKGKDDHLNYPIIWWEQVGKERYPTLYRMALDYLSIPATSCGCERAFSRGRRTVTNDRNRLQGATIESLQLQKNWL
jgi:hypothetical protein